MKIMRWTPSRDLVRLQEEMDHLFESLWQGRTPAPGDGPGSAWAPAADIRETGDEFYVRLDLPGVDKKDVKVSIVGDTLVVRGERREQVEQEDVNWHRVERFHGQFERSFSLGTAVQSDKVNATYKDGVLEIRVPKAESVKPREIPVEVTSSS
jgi:HSP20 family protein